MVVDRDSWPENGRVGRIGAGEYAGAYLLLAAEIQSSWAFYISDDPRVTDSEHLRTDDFWVADDDLPGVLAQMSVSWVPVDQDDEIEREVFDIRSEWVRRRRRSSGLRSLFRRLHPGADG
ncbi:hypothetical protein [Streptomyces sp. Ru72]|uniref:hypothetical protein n=1 Tax=Streptomyces sp. Ru72 TaxID=2080747 RepID=UPI0011B0586E|nr:hypothetical protein [Streptomyces sp. Ru72]